MKNAAPMVFLAGCGGLCLGLLIAFADRLPGGVIYAVGGALVGLVIGIAIGFAVAVARC